MYYDMISMLNVYSLTDQILQNSLMLLGDVVGVFLLTPPFLFCFCFLFFSWETVCVTYTDWERLLRYSVYGAGVRVAAFIFLVYVFIFMYSYVGVGL